MNPETIAVDHDLQDDAPIDNDRLVAELIDLETQKRLWLRARPALATPFPRV